MRNSNLAPMCWRLAACGTEPAAAGAPFTLLSNYEALFNVANLTAGGAAGVLTIDAVPAGDAYQTMNTQQYGSSSASTQTPPRRGRFPCTPTSPSAAAPGVTGRDVDVAANLALTATPASGDLYSYLLVRR